MNKLLLLLSIFISTNLVATKLDIQVLRKTPVDFKVEHVNKDKHPKDCKDIEFEAPNNASSTLITSKSGYVRKTDECCVKAIYYRFSKTDSWTLLADTNQLRTLSKAVTPECNGHFFIKVPKEGAPTIIEFNKELHEPK